MKKGGMRRLLIPFLFKTAYLERRVLYTITTKNFSKILSAVKYLLWTTIREGIIRVRKLSLNGSQFVYFYPQRISLHQ